MFQERQDLWNQMESLQNKEQDPKRYANRGGQLLKEEKERKRINIMLPKLEAKLIEMVESFEEEFKRPFTIFGVPVQDIFGQDYDKKGQEKLTKSGKKIAATPALMRVNTTGLRTVTVEQTLINRMNIKSTGCRLKLQPQRTLSTAASSTASSIRSIRTENRKRIMKIMSENTRDIGNNASRKQVKNASIKVYNVGSIIKRHSRSRKSIGKKRRSSMMKMRKIPSIVSTSTDDQQNLTDTSYEGFENYVNKSKNVVRSSEVNRPHYLPVNHHEFASPLIKKATLKQNATPSSSTPSKNINVQPKELEFSMIIKKMREN